MPLLRSARAPAETAPAGDHPCDGEAARAAADLDGWQQAVEAEQRRVWRRHALGGLAFAALLFAADAAAFAVL